MNKPNYWAILPAVVRYDNSLSPFSRILFSEINALLDKDGNCFASNDYFSRVFGVSKRTIEESMKNLKERGYIKSKVIRGERNQIVKREIHLPQKYVVGTTKICETPTTEICGDTSINNITNNKGQKRKRFVPPSVSDVAEYCRSRNNSVDAEDFVNHYQANGWMRGKTKIKDWKACVRTWEKNQKANGAKPVSEYGRGGL